MREQRDDDIEFLAVRYPNYPTCDIHSQVIFHVLDDLKGNVWRRLWKLKLGEILAT
jgi:hypothetical protein